jgi:hypothetical protein
MFEPNASWSLLAHLCQISNGRPIVRSTTTPPVALLH